MGWGKRFRSFVNNGHTELHFVMSVLRIFFTFQAPIYFSSVQFSRSVVSTLCDPMNRSTPGLPVHPHLPEFTQTHFHRAGDAIQPSHPLSSSFPPAPNPSQHQVSLGEVTQSCLTLCDPVDCDLLGFSVHGILEARILEWVAIFFSRGSSRPRD